MNFNLRMKNRLRLCAILSVLLTAACSDEDPDPRQAFAGAYEMNDFDVLITIGVDDSTIEVSTNPEIEIEFENGLRTDELKIELEEFVGDVINETLGALEGAVFTFDIDDDDSVVEISGNEFELDDVDFDLIYSDGGTTVKYPCEISGEGKLEGEELTLEFEIALYAGGVYTFKGTAVGTRD